MNRRTARRDRGFTLVEILLAVSLTGALAAVVAAAVIVVLRSEDGIARSVGESHDIQQVVNYLPNDVGVAPTDPAAFTQGGSPICGAGDNVLSIAYPNGAGVSYVLTTAGAAIKLDRIECDGTGVTSEVNIADLLDPDAVPAASASIEVVDGEVAQVTLDVTRLGGKSAQIVASPHETEALPDAITAGGICGNDDPLHETQGFLTFVENDSLLSGTADVYKAIGMGGELTFHGAQIASHGGNDTYRPASVGLYASTVNWAGSTGTLTVLGAPTGHVVLVDEIEGVDIETSKNGPITRIREFGSAGAPQIEAQKGQLKGPNPGHTIQFPAAFIELKACSEAIGQLPRGCDGCAVHAVPLHINANAGNRLPYLGTGDLKLDLTPGVTNILNIGESRLAAIGAVTPTYLDVDPNGTDSLIINVIDDDPSNDIPADPANGVEAKSVVRLANPMRFQNYTTKVMWNFPGIDRVELPNGIWGTVYAPFSTVAAANNVQGNLVGAGVELTGGVINEARSFEGLIHW